MAMNEIVTALENIGPMSAAEITAHLGISRLVINKQIRKLREYEVLRIARYDRQPDGKQGAFIPVYGVGLERDATPPSARPTKDIQKRHRERYKAIISAKRFPDHKKAMGVWAGLL